MTRPLWQLLIGGGERADAPTCEECRAILGLLADLATLGPELAGAERRRLRSAVRRHLACCDECRDALASMVREMERFAATETAGQRGRAPS